MSESGVLTQESEESYKGTRHDYLVLAGYELMSLTAILTLAKVISLNLPISKSPMALLP